MEEHTVHNSYTAYKNNIGLSDGKHFIKDTHDVVLNFPYKDCVLEDGQSSEDGEDTYFRKAGYLGDLTELLKNAENYKNRIENAQTKIKEIETKKTELNTLKNKRKKLGKKIFGEYQKQKERFNKNWHELLSSKNEEQKKIIREKILRKDIDLNTEIKFDEEKFYQLIHEKLDKRKYKIDSVKEKFNNINSIDTWKEFFEHENFENEDLYDSIQKVFFDLNTRNQYITVLPELTYKDKPIDKLSAGQKSTLYLKLQLATDTFSTPIIFDQPEDDLDNDFIIRELVPLIKEIKKYRQIILVTHNANIVVNADAEEIIIAKNEKDETLSYESGSIENEKIKESICNILDGGRLAFEQRRKKYSF